MGFSPTYVLYKLIVSLVGVRSLTYPLIPRHVHLMPSTITANAICYICRGYFWPDAINQQSVIDNTVTAYYQRMDIIPWWPIHVGCSIVQCPYETRTILCWLWDIISFYIDQKQLQIIFKVKQTTMYLSSNIHSTKVVTWIYNKTACIDK